MTSIERCSIYFYNHLRDHCCIECGEKNVILLEFAHKDRQNKLDNVSTLRAKGKFEEMVAEMQKCDVLCVSCHKQHTAKESKWYRLQMLHEEEMIFEEFDNDTIESLKDYD